MKRTRDKYGRYVDAAVITTCEFCGGTAHLTKCDCCGLWYCRKCSSRPDEGGNDCPNDDCYMHPVYRR